MCDIMRGDIDGPGADSRMRSTRRRDCEPPLPEPLAYFLTWPTYGTWLPGDERVGRVPPRLATSDPARKREAQARLTEDACLLDQDQRRLVELTIADHCRVRGWTLYTVNCRSNHVHVIVAGDREPKEIRSSSKPGAPAGSRRCSRNVSVHSPHMIPRLRRFARNGGLSVEAHLCQRRGRP